MKNGHKIAQILPQTKWAQPLGEFCRTRYRSSLQVIRGRQFCSAEMTARSTVSIMISIGQNSQVGRCATARDMETNPVAATTPPK
jgi:hypothetical protein